MSVFLEMVNGLDTKAKKYYYRIEMIDKNSP
jgi:hypothetical protein